MAPVTEVAILPAHAGTNWEDTSSPAGSTWQGILNTVASQPGAQEIYWGRTVEDPTSYRLFVDWAELSDHQNFIKSSIYKPFIDRLGTILSSPAYLSHFNLSPSTLSKVLNPTTGVYEVLTARLPPGSDSEQYTSTFLDFCKTLASSSDCSQFATPFHAGGGQIEPDKDDSEGKVFVGLLGWQSVEAHMQGRQTETFKEHVKGLRSQAREGGLNVVHVHFQRHEGGDAGAGGAGSGMPVSGQEEILNPAPEDLGAGIAQKRKPKTDKDGETKGGGVGVQFIDGHR